MEKLGELTEVASLERPATMDYWDDLLGFAHQQIDIEIADPRRAYGMKLAIEELLSNIIRSNTEADHDHLSIQQITVQIISSRSASQDGQSFVLQTKDGGLPFDPHFDQISDQARTIPIHERKPGGLGLFLIKTSVDEALYAHRDGLNTYWLILHNIHEEAPAKGEG